LHFILFPFHIRLTEMTISPPDHILFPRAPMDVDTTSEVAVAIDDLMKFLGAEEMVYSDRIPEGWKGALG
jgi:hypothetical protein